MNDGAVDASGGIDFWLIRIRPGWHSDETRYDWPPFGFHDVVVNVSKHPLPCVLQFQIEGLQDRPVNVCAPCPDTVESPHGIPGVRVRIACKPGILSVRLNDEEVVDFAIGE